jgi:hypothetical protein
MWEPRHLTTLWPSTACYRGSFMFIFYIFLWIFFFGDEYCEGYIQKQNRYRSIRKLPPSCCPDIHILMAKNQRQFSHWLPCIKQVSGLICKNIHCSPWDSTWRIGGFPVVNLKTDKRLVQLCDPRRYSNPSSRTMALGSPRPPTEMRTRNLPGAKGRPVCKADNLTAICEPTV